MTRFASMLRTRLLYPHFLFKKGSRMHILFMACLFLILAFATFGISKLIDVALMHFGVPFPGFISVGTSLIAMWGLIYVLAYGVTHG